VQLLADLLSGLIDCRQRHFFILVQRCARGPHVVHPHMHHRALPLPSGSAVEWNALFLQRSLACLTSDTKLELGECAFKLSNFLVSFGTVLAKRTRHV
jgi:hypothetical protein